MAAVSVLCWVISIVLCSFFVFETSGKNIYTYLSDEPVQNVHLEFVPLRQKRYVFDTMDKLADGYDKGHQSQDFIKSDHVLPKKRAEFISNVAVMGEREAAPQRKVELPITTEETHETTSTSNTTPSPPPKSTKKPIIKTPKKFSESEAHNATVTPQEPEKCTENCDVDNFPKEVSNNTLAKNNITDKQVDHHYYYNSTFFNGEQEGRHYWVDMDTEKGVIVSEMLSQSHRRAATIRLKFEFPFYGHFVRNMTVATGGFIYTGDYIHSWLAATQYIAPLMANFETSASKDSLVKYRDNGTAFTVEWDSVVLQDKKDAGKFTFQATLYKNGDIVFVYRNIPMLVEKIEDTLHPVKVGISDAYIFDKTVFYIRKKTIFEYHRVNFNRDDIKNWTVIYLKALPTCLDYKTCNSCLTHTTSFESNSEDSATFKNVTPNSVIQCKWCDEVNRCSSGYDRHFQEWLNNKCHHSAATSTFQCSVISQRNASQALSVEAHSKMDENTEANLGHSGMLGLFIGISVLTCLGLWVYHAYRNPHTRLGQILIKYRPSQWRMRRGEARYTAASIHM